MALYEEFAFIFFYASLPFICDVFDLEIWGYLKLSIYSCFDREVKGSRDI